MNPAVSLTPHEVVRLLSTKRRLWLTPAIACAVLAAGYALVAPRYWEASQALVVRQETAGSSNSTPGKFADLYEMRTLQETILELAKSRQVVVDTLLAVDRQLTGVEPNPPTPDDIDKFRDRLKMLPPHGGEFGKTEVFYFSVQDTNRDRAMALVGELCRQLDAGLKQLRTARAGGLIVELEEQVALASETHAAETKRLVEFETAVGADLGELRMLHSASSGQSDLRQESVMLEADMRKFQTQLREVEQLHALLKAAQKDPLKLIATPNSLLASQPALRRLKEGLVDAQLATARTAGTRSAEHPRVQAAVEREAQVRADLHRELGNAVNGADVELQLAQQRVAATQTRLTSLQGRLSQLAEQRATYSNRVAAVDNSRISLDQSRQKLSAAQAAQAAAQTSSLVTRIDVPETGAYPVGPGRTAIAAAGGVGGLMLGLGLVFLSAGPKPGSQTSSTSASRTETPSRERRRSAGRSTDQQPAATPTAGSESAEWWNAIRNTSSPIASAADITPAAQSAPIAPVISATTVVATSGAAATAFKLPTKAPAPEPMPPALPVTPGVLPVATADFYSGLSLQAAVQGAAAMAVPS